jgi:hypothetical protein
MLTSLAAVQQTLLTSPHPTTPANPVLTEHSSAPLIAAQPNYLQRHTKPPDRHKPEQDYFGRHRQG